MRTTGIERVWLTPDDVPPSDDALAAIAEAELIVLGPGSLYTSLLPSLLIPAIRDAVLARRRACASSSATWPPRTARPPASTSPRHVEALVAHTAPGLVDVVLANNHFGARTPPDWPAEPVRLRWPPDVAAVAAPRPRRRRRPRQRPPPRPGPPRRRAASGRSSASRGSRHRAVGRTA